ncbi:MltG/YceG/YrrL family protein [Paenibacillus guangzhouensis]|uniref:hypothetical protein n=1 Tax=Paenibacillus guangzhouensis TaxID=1473112 RepID=UPI001266CF3A|nr:hypothetical protein [Paenibacillus guangzhouensis]
MINKRHFFLGLGSGLILGSVLLQLMLAANPVQPKNNQTELSAFTVEQLEAEAMKLDMHLVPADAKAYTSEQLKELLKTKEAEWRASQAQTQQVTVQPKDNSTTASTPPAQEKTNVEAPKVTLKIVAGMSLVKVSDKLEDLGIVDSSAKFVAYGKKHGINSKIRTGTYELSADQTFAEIAKIITTRP